MGKTHTQSKEVRFLNKKLKYGMLQKLKWYCEICQTQCNDQHAFRQHVQSEKHRNMMAHFRQDSKNIINQNSRAFETSFMDVLKNRYPNKEVSANVIYTQVIKDKHHVHMNSTRWESVHGFCLYLEQTGKIQLRMTERGPYLRYIAKDETQIIRETEEEMLSRQRALAAKKEQEIVNAMLKNTISTMQNDNSASDVVHLDAVKISAPIEQASTKKKVSSLFSGRTFRPKAPEKPKSDE